MSACVDKIFERINKKTRKEAAYRAGNTIARAKSWRETHFSLHVFANL